MIRKILTVLCLVLFLTPLQGQEQGQADSLYVFRFVAEKDMFYIPWKGNKTEMERLCFLVQQHKQAILDGTLPIHVDSYCYLPLDPGKASRLARVRGLRVKSELITRVRLTEACFVTRTHLEKWEEQTSVVTVTLHLPRVKAVVSAPVAKKTAPVIEKTVPVVEEVATGTPPVEEKHPDQSARETSGPTIKKRTGAFALRTNLLRWATLTPDLGMEWRINRHVGILVNGSWTSWSWKNKDRRYALWKVSPEVRYYTGKEKRGFLGVMYHAGGFNYKFSTTGKQGDYQGGGITGGYLLPLSKALSLDVHAGLGYTRADYDKYSVENGVRVRQGSGNKNYWGINQLEITLVWEIIK